jgi:hypothetical protein
MERIMNVPPALTQIAQKVLGWMFYAKMPLLVPELIQGLSFDGECGNPSGEMIIMACKSLVIIHGRGPRFVHFTVSQYLHDNRDKYDWIALAPLHISRICMGYLSRLWEDEQLVGKVKSLSLPHPQYDSIADWETLDKHCSLRHKLWRRFPLAQHAADHWGHYIAEALQNATCPKELGLEVEEALVSGDLRGSTCWFMSLDLPYYAPEPELNGVHILAYFGIHRVLRTLAHAPRVCLRIGVFAGQDPAPLGRR